LVPEATASIEAILTSVRLSLIVFAPREYESSFGTRTGLWSRRRQQPTGTERVGLSQPVHITDFQEKWCPEEDSNLHATST
jgi:hypothetical protein